MKSPVPLKIVVPLVMGIVVTLAIAVYAELSYRSLESANRQMAAAVIMQSTLHETLALVIDAETGQRGHMLSGKEEYLEPYNRALPRLDEAFSRLRELLVVNGSLAQRESVGRFQGLVGKKLAELEATLTLFRAEGAEPALKLMNTGIGRRTMDQIRAEVDEMALQHRGQVVAATQLWNSDIAFARFGMQLMTAFTVSLLLVVWLLARRDARQREERRLQLAGESARLQQLVEDRTAQLSDLSNHLQLVREDEKSKLARDIHDELGGILVSAKMDVAWVEERLTQAHPDYAAKLARAQAALDDGVNIKRRIIEDLRPTLLDNLGLGSALDWQIHEICDRAGLQCTIETPDDDSTIPPGTAIALYRIVQEALTNIVKYARAKHVGVEMLVGGGEIALVIDDDGIGISESDQSNLLAHGITGMRQRVHALHGEFSIRRREEGGTRIEVSVPLVPVAPTSGG
ncbi:MAG: CHASE3 domain-containing protein [Casimicrobiaceae bacterium]